MSWAGCQNNPIDLNFYLQKRLEIFEKKIADKFWSNKFKRVKMPCSVPDRIKDQFGIIQNLQMSPIPLTSFLVGNRLYFQLPWSTLTFI